jgi:hypothetical protein
VFSAGLRLEITALAGGALRYAASAFLAFPGLCQTSNANFGSIKPAKGFRLLETEASQAEVTPRGLDVVQQLVDRLSNIVLFSWFWMDFAHVSVLESSRKCDLASAARHTTHAEACRAWPVRCSSELVGTDMATICDSENVRGCNTVEI